MSGEENKLRQQGRGKMVMLKKNRTQIVIALLCVLMCAALFAGCAPAQNNKTEKVKLPMDGDSVEMSFSSGVGAWETELTLHSDGSFEGNYHDSEMDDADDDYPNGTVYYCVFKGTFTDIAKVDEYSYSMKLENITAENPKGEETIGSEEGIRYIASDPYGFEEGKEFIFYLPGTPTDGLSEDFLSWWPELFDDDEDKDALSDYALRNVAKDYGFFA